MYSISTLTPHPTAVYAAEELKKYLRMMMPRAGNIPLHIASDHVAAFRLGLMQDFNLDVSDAEDPALDDIIYIDTTAEGGIIAGSNYGALLIAVYRYLRQCGCRWLFPGVDGEWIPSRTSLEPVKYRKLADHRYRGQCNEGAEYQANMLETIEFSPKIGLNSYMLEFDIPFLYYNKYYSHKGSVTREPEPVNNETILQWKRQCEVEIQKRGMHFHDMGHGWTAEPFGIDSKAESPENIPDDMRDKLAMINGKRDFHLNPLYSNVCLSNPEVRATMASYIADYAETQNNVDFLHIWLADGTDNHCECEECRKKIVSDWYVILLNEIDAELTRRNLDTHIVFIVYTETFWPPLETKLENTERFTMLYAPHFRLYTETYAETPDEDAVKPFQLNHNVAPKGMAECLGYLKAWKKVWSGDCFCYEYHFWQQQYFDPSGMRFAKLLYDDICALSTQGLSGMIEDGSQRSYFPTGFAYYVYGETLFDKSRSFEELMEDYFSHAFGASWREVVCYLNRICDTLDFSYFSGQRSSDISRGPFYNPDMAKLARKIPEITASVAPLIAAEKNQTMRAASVSWRMLDLHREWIEGIAEMVCCLAVGKKEEALEAAKRLFGKFSTYEIYIERYFDLYMAHFAISKKIGEF